jgi:DNA-binding NtrC family response regulator
MGQPSQGSGLPDQRRHPDPPAASTAGQRRALVVDDESSIRLALRRFLTRDGWHVDDAPDGRAALNTLQGTGGQPAHYDLIICDLRMPGYGGAELHEWLRLHRPDLLARLIVATGDAVSPEAADFVQRTSCPVLQKPFELSELRILVERLAGRAP